MTSFQRRVILGAIGTIVIVLIVVVQALFSSNNEDTMQASSQIDGETTLADREVDSAVDQTVDESASASDDDDGTTTTTTAVEINPNWAQKRSSRYGDRQPTVTVTTIQETTTTQPDDDAA